MTLLLLSGVLSMPYKLGYTPELSRPQDNVRDDKHPRIFLFTNYKSSQELCTDYYRSWWDEWINVRMRPRRTKRPSTVEDIVAEIMSYYGPPVTYMGEVPYIGPTQSLKAQYGSFYDDRRPVQVENKRDCFGYCEDRRTAFEIWLSSWIIFKDKLRVEVRDRGPFNMRCQEGFIALILPVQDRREPPKVEDDYDDGYLVHLIQRFDSTFKGEKTYISRWEGRDQSVGEDVDQCFCVPDPEASPKPVRQTVTCADFEGAFEVNQCPAYKRLRSDISDAFEVLQNDFDEWIQKNAVQAKLMIVFTLSALLYGDALCQTSMLSPKFGNAI